tara:strand:- start:5123 stop:6391 length:1269 start_codon:yes stop_codon:yes gene_type:complete
MKMKIFRPSLNKKSKKKILLIGGGLYGCLLAYQFSKKKNYEVILVEKSNKLLSSFNSISIKKLNINNGFHGIEIPRCNDLLDFIKKKLKMEMIVRNKIQKLLIYRSMIDFKDGINKWPKILSNDLKKKFNVKNFKIASYFKNDFKKLIKLCSKRYSNNFKNCYQFFIPWFLPREYKISNIKDEGDLFREKVRNNKVLFQYAQPKEKIFQIFQKKFYNFLNNVGVRIFFNTQVRLEKNNIKILESDQSKTLSYDYFDKIFYCTHSPFLLEYSNIKHLKKLNNYKKFMINLIMKVNTKVNFTEMICLNNSLPNLNRISVLSSSKNYSNLQLEIIQTDMVISKETIALYKKEIKAIFKLKKNPQYYGHKMSRLVFYPSKNWKEKATKFIKNWKEKNNLKIFLRYDLFGAINMAKCWNYAKIDSKL